jgi:hypothetical protein
LSVRIVGFAVVALGALAVAYGCSSFESDGTVPAVDAQAEAEAAVDSGPPPLHFCQTMPDAALCKDFDDEDPVTDGFTTIYGDAGARDSRFSVSPPSSLVVVGQSVNDVVALERELAESTRGYEARMQIRLGDDDGNLPPTDFLQPIRLETRSGLEKCAVDLLLSKGSLDIVAGSVDSRPPLTRRPTPGKWSAVRMELKRGDDGKMRVGVDVDGESANDGPPIELGCAFQGNLFFAIGARYSAAGVTVRFDDVAVHRY